ncbi:hypothetical protein K435DRAFT_745439 [Dendrothele bispora CBS 962.96]|uniref:Uncharacterized protein n=1 Tax=Dendrothele bispora (strain CBS 962.96) TaxID=1314807 RepID=A0A4S8MQA5_DENBC|nr:hypothetical protein K435DRAFT_745439 [Dendrothele bispora CBS 962.96]
MMYDVDDDILRLIYTSTDMSTAVCLRKSDGHFQTFPYNDPSLNAFEDNVRLLNPAIAVKLSSAAIRASVSTLPLYEQKIPVGEGTNIQVLQFLEELPSVQRDQCAAFIREDSCLIVWEDKVDLVIDLCKDLEARVVQNLRQYEHVTTVPGNDQKNVEVFHGQKMEISDDFVLENGSRQSCRPVALLAPIYNGIAAAFAIYFVSTGIKTLLQEYARDGETLRFALCSTIPFTICIGLFFCTQMILGLAMLFGPTSQYQKNSLYYSAIKPPPNPDTDRNLPHITIQMSVYRESLEKTIEPTISSIKKAMKTYARQGGSSSIFICDDGLSTLGEEDIAKRIAFYAMHDIGWVARPPHSTSPDGFKRPGQFKKASNLNYGLALSMKLEKHLDELYKYGETDSTTGESLEERALKSAIEEMYNESGNQYTPWASNAKNLTIGEIILLVDADTVIPEDCFRDAAREMAESPEVAIIQHESGVLQVAHHYFENGIAHFTRRINQTISLGCANGEVSPFVGHNAFLRWSAIQDVSFFDIPACMTSQIGVRKYWSESHVSEDFDMALRLLNKGYVVRWATYAQGGFKEGVSLTLIDEVARWQKYAYGCNELLFNPLVRWPVSGPISKRIRNFVWSNVPVHYKLNVLAYMFSYYGIAASGLISIFNYLFLGLSPSVDGFYHKSFEVLLACLFVFPALGNASLIILEWRIGRRSLLMGALDQLQWIVFFLLFFGGITFHVSAAILAHLFSYKMTWTSTSKEVRGTTCWKEVARAIKCFWYSFLISGVFVIVVIVMNSNTVPVEWRISAKDWAGVVPVAAVAGCSILMPLVLNPWILKLVY